MVYFRNVGFLFAFAFCTQAMAMYDPQVDEKDGNSYRLQVHRPSTKESHVKKEIGKIETLVENLRDINPIDFDFQKACDLLKQHAPDYSMEPENIINLYHSITRVARGGEAYVWKAILKEDRPQAGLKPGDTIAIRMVTMSPRKPLEKLCKNPGGFEPLIRASHLRNPKDKKTITEYFPSFYGIYYGPAMPNSLVEGSYFEEMTSKKDWVYRYEEMEWINTTFEEKKFNQKWKIPDSVIFEFMYGEWVGEFFVGLCIDDGKYRNYGLKTVNYGRCYHFGNDNYYFSCGEMPVRLDLARSEKCPHPATKKFYRGSLSKAIDDTETHEGKRFLQDLSNQTSDLFTLFSQHFGNYRKERAWVEQNDPSARHFEVDQKWIDVEKALPKE